MFGIPTAAPEVPVDEWVRRSQDDWQAVRRSLNRHRVPLAHAASRLYPEVIRLADTGMLAPAEWLPAGPVDLGQISLHGDAKF